MAIKVCLSQSFQFFTQKLRISLFSWIVCSTCEGLLSLKLAGVEAFIYVFNKLEIPCFRPTFQLAATSPNLY